MIFRKSLHIKGTASELESFSSNYLSPVLLLNSSKESSHVARAAGVAEQTVKEAPETRAVAREAARRSAGTTSDATGCDGPRAPTRAEHTSVRSPGGWFGRRARTCSVPPRPHPAALTVRHRRCGVTRSARRAGGAQGSGLCSPDLLSRRCVQYVHG